MDPADTVWNRSLGFAGHPDGDDRAEVLEFESDASYDVAVPADSVIESAFRSKLLELP